MTTNSPPQRSITLLLACLLSAGAAAQEAQTNGAPKIFRDKVEPHWFAGNNKFWYGMNSCWWTPCRGLALRHSTTSGWPKP